jgi:hypothetical protein
MSSKVPSYGVQIDAVEKPADTSPPRRSRAGKYARKTRLITAEALDGRTRACRLYNQLISGIEADLGGRDQVVDDRGSFGAGLRRREHPCCQSERALVAR